MTDRSRNTVLWWGTAWLIGVAAQAEPSYTTPLALLGALAVVRAAWLTFATLGALRDRSLARWRRRALRRRGATDGERALLAALEELLPAGTRARPALGALRSTAPRIELVRGASVVAVLRLVTPEAWGREGARFGAAWRRPGATRAPVVLVPAKTAYAPSELALYLDEAFREARPAPA